ncbi:DUF7144 family membrane protein [Agromyces marinus]|uniref:DUF7144 domain-containing protein n=1 Tax=Agromyces marinus TaxID=1389020 RepID=A0ABM8H3L3_9MICO|nr:hypothetical protein [Agromyces marinus]UIP59555.1 hypothetical protein DSM26151_24660 [Agromyces marinus]BDZ55388.1 hypothetical protein GCM10025870_24610 [Agromyces marinus]
MSEVQGSRPVTVTIIGLLAFIAGALDMVSGVVLFFLLPVQEVVDGFGGTGPMITAATVSIVIGLVTAVLAGGLLRGSQGARLIVTVLQVLSVIGSLFLAVAYLGIPVGEWIGIAVSAVVLILLWTPKASAFFTR